MHPYLTEALAAERIRDWQQQAARAQLAKRSRRAGRARGPVAAGRPPLRAGRVPPAQPEPVSAGLPRGGWLRLPSIGRQARRRRGVWPAARCGAQPDCCVTLSSWKV